MAHVVALGVGDDALAALAPLPVDVRRADDVGAVDADATRAVVVPAAGGVAIAQSVHARAPHVSVVLVADDAAARDAVAAELTLTPGIGRHTRCVVAGTADAAAAVRDEVERAGLRLEHEHAMVEVRSTVAGLVGDAPASASVYLGQLFQHSPLGILLVDPQGIVQAVNPGLSRILGWQPGRTARLPVTEVLAGADGTTAAHLVEQGQRTGQPVEGTLTRTDPKHGQQHLEVIVTPVDPQHPDLGVFVLLRDETARIQAVADADDARRAAEADAERYAELAWTLQESLLPPDLPTIPGVGVGARFHPAGDGSEIGGDFYDIFQVTDDEWFAVIGDICGKGAGAARLTALTRYTLRATTVRTRTVERNLSDLNGALARQYELDRPRGQHRFATATVLRFRPAGDGRLSVDAGSGGHPPPLVVRADGTVEELPCRGPLLGIFSTGTFTSARAEVAPGDVLVLYTDGVLEARRGEEEFGEDRLRALLEGLAGRSPDSVAGAVEAAVLSFQAGIARDDIAVVALGPVLS